MRARAPRAATGPGCTKCLARSQAGETRATIAPTSSAKLIPAASAAAVVMPVSVRPGIVLISSTCGCLVLVEDEIDAREVAAAHQRVALQRHRLDPRARLVRKLGRDLHAQLADRVVGFVAVEALGREQLDDRQRTRVLLAPGWVDRVGPSTVTASSRPDDALLDEHAVAIAEGAKDRARELLGARDELDADRRALGDGLDDGGQAAALRAASGKVRAPPSSRKAVSLKLWKAGVGMPCRRSMRLNSILSMQRALASGSEPV